MQILLIAFVTLLGSIQQPGSRSSPGETAPLSPQMRAVISALTGRWSITLIDKDGRAIGDGEEVWKIVPGGVFTEENRSRVNGKAADDYAAIWWDGKTQKVLGVWCNALINDEGCTGFDLSMEGKDVVMTGEWEYQGKRLAWREIFSSTGTALTQTLYIGEPGKELELSETIRGTRR